MSPALLPLLAALCAPPAAPAPVELEARRVEAGPAGWRATDLVLRVAGGRLSAPAARAEPSADCPGGAVRLTGPLRFDGPQLTIEAERVALCLPGGALRIEALSLRGPHLSGRAGAARWRDGALDADDLSVSACGCADPPWRVDARRAEVVPGEGAWVTWPVLRAGGVPVLAAPVAYVPLARRRTGFLLPRLGFDGDDGLYGALPFFWAPLPSLDLTLAPGGRAAQGFTADGRLRWAASAVDEGEVEAWTAPQAAQLVASGRGSAPLGPLRLAVDGRWADDRASWVARNPGVFARARGRLFADLGAAATAGGLGVGARLHHGLRFAGPDGAPAATATLPVGWLRLGGGVGPARVVLDGAALRVLRDPGPDAEVFDVALEADAVHWLGPVRLRPVLAGRSRIHPAGDAPEAEADRALAAMAALEAEVAVGRAYAAGTHRVALTVDARAAAARAAARPVEAADRPLDARGLGAALSTRFAGRAWLLDAALRADYDAERGAGPLWLRARADGPWIGLALDAAAVDDATALRLDGRIGPAAGPRLVGGWLRFAADPALPWLRPVGPVLPIQQETPIASAHGAVAGAVLPVGPLTASWTGALDLDRPGLAGQIATLDWRGRCDCWSAGLWMGHEAGRAAPDVMLTVRLGDMAPM